MLWGNVENITQTKSSNVYKRTVSGIFFVFDLFIIDDSQSLT